MEFQKSTKQVKKYFSFKCNFFAKKFGFLHSTC